MTQCSSPTGHPQGWAWERLQCHLSRLPSQHQLAVVCFLPGPPCPQPLLSGQCDYSDPCTPWCDRWPWSQGFVQFTSPCCCAWNGGLTSCHQHGDQEDGRSRVCAPCSFCADLFPDYFRVQTDFFFFSGMFAMQISILCLNSGAAFWAVV